MSLAFQPTDKTPEELAAQRARRLQQRIARALLKEDSSGDTAIDDAVRTLRATVNDPKERRATRDHAAGVLLSNANKAAGAGSSLVIQQGIQIDAASLLRLVQSGTPGHTTTGIPGPERIADVSPEALPMPSDATSPPEAVVTAGGEDPEPELGTAAHREWQDRHRPAPPTAAVVRCPDCGSRTDDELHVCLVGGSA